MMLPKLNVVLPTSGNQPRNCLLDPGACLLVESRPCEADNINPVHEQTTIAQFLQLLPSQGNHITMPVWVVEVAGWEFLISLFHLMEERNYNSEMFCESPLFLLTRKYGARIWT